MGVVPRKAAKLEKVGSNWKKRPLVVIAAKLGSAGTKLFAQKHAQELWDCNRVDQILIPTLQRVTTPLFLAKNSQNRAKSNRIFPEKSRRDRTLILQYLDSPMAKFCPLRIKFFRFWPPSQSKMGSKLGKNWKRVQTLVTCSFRKNLNFPKFFEMLFSSPWILPLVQISVRSDNIRGS